jgi:sarcosine oxidase subunit alpha
MSMRLPKQTGEWINREKPLNFTFEGNEYSGYEGDTISSALLANGQKLLGRSFKYHRARGVLSFANHDINALVTDGLDTNIRADVVPLKDGWVIKAVNTDGGVKKDRNRYFEMLAPLLPVGFYYKAFHTPRRLFPFWEKIIRKAAGLGIVNFNFPRITKRKLNQHCDVLVIGAGPAGLSAAIYAAQEGLSVTIVDENQQAGGALSYDLAGDQYSQTRSELLAKIAELPNINMHLGAYAAGYYTDHLIPIVGINGITKVRAKSVIVASGAFEQPPVFRNNDLPGVMLGSAAQRLIHRYGVKPFNTGVVFTANSYGYRVVLDLINAGVKVAALVDLRANAREPLAAELSAKGIKIYTGYCVYEATPDGDKSGITGVLICPFNEQTNEAKPDQAINITCDGIAMSAGWAPAAGLLYQSGASMRFDYTTEQFVPEKLQKGVFASGAVNGIYGLEQTLLDGRKAAAGAIGHLGKPVSEIDASSFAAEAIATISHPYPIIDHPKGKNFVDFDEDIQLKDFINAAKEGFDNIELMKRFTTVGMGPSQGKHSNMNAIRILAKIRGLPVEKVGTTTSRPFFHPTPFGHLGGRSFHPQRLTSLHSWHEGAGAVFADIGAWSRPSYYPRSGLSKQEAVQQEASAVRHKAGLIDAGTLGKIEVCGPDAAIFLERFYTGSFASQKVGTTRYAMLLDESGVIVDDGLASRLHEELFYITISTSNAAAVYREMQRWLQIWQLNAVLINVTGAYGAMNLAGPLSRDILSSLTTLDISDQAFAFGAIQQTKVAGIPARIIRSGFVAELAYEIHVPAADAPVVWNAILEAGKHQGLQLFGTEAQRLLRLEMGHHLPGHDTDGLTNPFEIGAKWALKMDKPFFIGQRSLQIIAKKPLNKKLVPFTLATDFNGEIPLDCNLVIEQGEIKGRVTSIAYSPAAKSVIGLAYVAPHQAEVGHTFEIRTDNGSLVKATVATTPFFKAE